MVLRISAKIWSHPVSSKRYDIPRHIRWVMCLYVWTECEAQHRLKVSGIVFFRRTSSLIPKPFNSSRHSSIHSFIPQAVLRQIHSLFQSEFSTECDLVLPLSIYSYPFVSLRLISSCLRLIRCLRVTFIRPYVTSIVNGKMYGKMPPLLNNNV